MLGRAEFCLLGPLLVRCDGEVVPVPRGKQRALLAVLLLNANHVVPMPVIADALWGPRPPPSAEVTVRNYVKRLRRVLAAAGPDLISTHPNGYLIRAGAGQLDTVRFEQLVSDGYDAHRTGSWSEAARHAAAALALWRGEPLADVFSETLELSDGARLADVRLQALELRIESDLRQGRHQQVIPELRRLRGTHPLREKPYALLMLALFRSGQQAAALSVYRQARDILVAELAVEPSPELRELHRRILNTDPALISDVPPPAPACPVPRELPTAVRTFTGRQRELATLTRLLAGPQETVVISAIGGTAGVGKTALTLHWAHQVAGQFPDGQLYVNLRGYDPGEPLAPDDALSGFLRALGVPAADIPAQTQARAARYRSLLAGRRVLVVLDNARSAEQVRPLLPATVGCVCVVTSRDSLAGLVARDGAQRLDLDLLSRTDAMKLLRALIGARVDAEPGAAELLVRQCARLPLALRLVAELAAARESASLGHLAKELAGWQQRLDLLDAGQDPRTMVRAVFSWSCRQLDPAAERGFRLIGLHPGHEIDGRTLAALAGIGVAEAEAILGRLARACLVQWAAAPGRYGTHDLLRDYARDLAVTGDPDERHRALTRLLDYYLWAATVAVDAVFPGERERRPGLRQAAPEPSADPEPPAEPATARTWLDAERTGLVGAIDLAADAWPAHAIGLAAVLFRYLDIGGHYTDGLSAHASARRAAAVLGDVAAEATALNHLGGAAWRLGRFDQALTFIELALTRFRAVGERTGEARVMTTLGIIHSELGAYDQAIPYFHQALKWFRADRDRIGQAYVLVNLGQLELQHGEADQGDHHLGQALALFRVNDDLCGVSQALGMLGDAALRYRRFAVAIRDYRESLELCRRIGNRPGQVRALDGLGAVSEARGDLAQARHHRSGAERIRAELRDC